MMGPGGIAPPQSRTLYFAGTTALLGLPGASAAGALEALARVAVDPLLADSRLDALAVVLWGIGVGAVAGFLLGAVSGALLAPRWGRAPATLWPVASVGAASLLAGLIEPWIGRAAAGWVAAPAGAAAGAALVVLLSLVAPAEGASRRFSRRPSPWPALAAAAAFVPILSVGLLGGRLLLGGTQAPPGSPSLLLITVDTLRADALGAFRDGRPMPAGLTRAATPQLDALASESAVFTEASSPIPKTPQAVASIMTGCYPGRHGVRDLFSAMGGSLPTLAQSLRASGWRTRAVVTNLLIGRGSGLSRGFDRFHDKDGLRPQVKRLAAVDLAARIAPRAVTFALNRFPFLRMGREDAGETTDRAIAALRAAAGRPYFLWVHYLDPHWTYWPPEPYRSQSDTRPESPFTLYDDVRSGNLPIGEMIHRNRMPAEEVERVGSLYAGEVSYADGELGRLLEAALGSPQGGRTIVAFTSDHGESLGEHGYFFSHGDLVHEPGIRVPLIIRPPGGRAGGRIATPVSLVDLLPTLLEMTGAPIPKGTQGVSLVPLMNGDAPPEGGPDARPIFAESDLSYLAENPHLTIPGEAGKIRSIRAGPYKLVRVPRDVEAAGRLDPGLGAANAGLRNALGFGEATRLGETSPDLVFLYDLAADPGETIDIAALEPARVDAMTRALDAWLAASVGPAAAGRAGSEELLEGLRSLGYVDPGGEKR